MLIGGRSAAKRRGVVPAAMAAVMAVCTVSCSSGGAKATTRYAVGIETETLVDSSRPTPPSGRVPGHAGRTLVTTILYPAQGAPAPTPVHGASPHRGGRFPLIVFAHGFDTAPDLSEYLGLLQQWAAAGYVVAAPLFPLTRADAPGGADLSDYVDQPGDLSFVVTEVLRESAGRQGVLAGLVDPQRIGAAGHSLGGVTTLGLVANTCCRDKRIKAAAVSSGDAVTFPAGTFDYRTAPPLLLVHGNADPAVPYVSSVDVFNSAGAPKGLLTIDGGDHGAPVNAGGPAFSSVVRTTIDFFDAYLKGQKTVLSRLQTDTQQGVTSLTFASGPGVHVTVPVPTTVTRHLDATVSPSQGLSNGQVVAVRWTGYVPGVAVNVLECSKSPPTSATDCNLQSAKLLQPDPTGTGSVSLVVHTGSVGTGTGICDAAHPGCVVAVNQGGSLAPSSTVLVPISFEA